MLGARATRTRAERGNCGDDCDDSGGDAGHRTHDVAERHLLLAHLLHRGLDVRRRLVEPRLHAGDGLGGEPRLGLGLFAVLQRLRLGSDRGIALLGQERLPRVELRLLSDHGRPGAEEVENQDAEGGEGVRECLEPGQYVEVAWQRQGVEPTRLPRDVGGDRPRSWELHELPVPLHRVRVVRLELEGPCELGGGQLALRRVALAILPVVVLTDDEPVGRPVVGERVDVVVKQGPQSCDVLLLGDGCDGDGAVCARYICWGVLAWVPAVYPCAQLYLAAQPQDISWLAAAACGVGGLAAIAINYAADAQRQRVRQSGGNCRVWGTPPKTIVAKYRGTDGQERENLLLVSGYWGLSRHFHYLPELSVALLWTLPAGITHVTPYFYVVFLGILLWDRAGRDDKRCAEKYGSAWATYRKMVPYKIVPRVY